MCVDSAGEPPTFLDSVPKTDSSPQPPPRALLAPTPYTLTSARSQISELWLVRESLYTILRLPPHPDASTDYHAVDSEGDPDAGERKAEVSRGLATSDVVRDDSHCLSLFLGSDVK